jgi:Flp pilus assembly protein TadD
MALTLERRRVVLLSLLGSVYSRLGQDALAEQTLSRALKLHPTRATSLMNLALARARALDIQGATEIYLRARAVVLDAPEAVELGQTLHQVEARLQALARLGTRREDPRAHALLAEIFALTNAPLRAIRELQEQIRLAPGDRMPRARLALEWARMGDGDQAFAVIREARRIFGEEPGLTDLEREVRGALEQRLRQGGSVSALLPPR